MSAHIAMMRKADMPPREGPLCRGRLYGQGKFNTVEEYAVTLTTLRPHRFEAP